MSQTKKLARNGNSKRARFRKTRRFSTHNESRNGASGKPALHDFPQIGIHNHLFKLALFLRYQGIEQTEAVRLIEEKAISQPLQRPLRPNEIMDQVASAYESKSRGTPTRRTTYQPLERTSPGSYWNKHIPSFDSDKLRDPRKIEYAIRNYPWRIEDMIKDSPTYWNDHNPCACPLGPYGLISELFDEKDIVGCGYRKKYRNGGVSYPFDLKRKVEWCVNREMNELIAPNPMRDVEGVNQEGKPSKRCRDNMGRRKYLVAEFDDKRMNHFDMASILRFLHEEIRPLVMVVYSGNHSLHGWFRSSGDEHEDYQFFKTCVVHGADGALWKPEQPARTPNAIRRDTGKKQEVLWFNPQKEGIHPDEC